MSGLNAPTSKFIPAVSISSRAIDEQIEKFEAGLTAPQREVYHRHLLRLYGLLGARWGDPELNFVAGDLQRQVNELTKDRDYWRNCAQDAKQIIVREMNRG